MHRIDTVTAQKDKFGAGKNGFTRGNPQTGVPATDLDDDYFDTLQEELAAIVEAAGDTLDKAKRNQVLQAAQKLFAPANDTIGALAALIGAANKLPYFTGPKNAALTDLTSVGRQIIASTTKEAVLEYLGLGDVQLTLKYGAPMIGELVMWSRPEMPQEWWPDMKMEFIPYMGQSFDPVKYPLLASIHSNATLPADMRAMFPRGWDNTRGVDPSRPIMNEQGDAMRKLTGIMNNSVGSGLIRPDGVLTGVFKRNATTVSGTPQGGSFTGSADPIFDNELTTPVATENRPKNVAWNMIVRAK